MSNIYSVSQLTQSIKQLLESGLGVVSVQGEVTNLRQQASGHLYFSLKDANSQISAVLFRGSARNLDKLPKAGEAIAISILTVTMAVKTAPMLTADRRVTWASSLVTNVTNRFLSNICFHLLSGRNHDLCTPPPFRSH